MFLEEYGYWWALKYSYDRIPKLYPIDMEELFHVMENESFPPASFYDICLFKNGKVNSNKVICYISKFQKTKITKKKKKS